MSVSVWERWKTCSVVRVTGNRFAMSEEVKPKANASPQHCFVVSCHNCEATVYLVSNLGCRGGFSRNFENETRRNFCQICRRHC